MKYRNISGETIYIPNMPEWPADEVREISYEIINVNIKEEKDEPAPVKENE